jgi:5-methyltetrahydropteroyltriglutamate--homocysteine methyltransferase
MINVALSGRPRDMVVTTHICRGNRQSSWLATGGYEPIADVLFNQMDFDAYFLEYDDDRAGGFEPLRWFPRAGDKVVVLGLVTTKTGALEAVDALARRIEEAASFVPIERLCVSPQCGFASTEEGNALTADQQWAKLERLVATARVVWG